MVRSTDPPAMTIAVDLGHKATKTNKQTFFTCQSTKVAAATYTHICYVNTLVGTIDRFKVVQGH